MSLECVGSVEGYALSVSRGILLAKHTHVFRVPEGYASSVSMGMFQFVRVIECVDGERHTRALEGAHFSIPNPARPRQRKR